MCGVVEDWASKDGRGRAVAVTGELLSEFFLRSLFFVGLKRDLSGDLILSTWQESIGWRKTLVLRHSLIERFLLG